MTAQIISKLLLRHRAGILAVVSSIRRAASIHFRVDIIDLSKTRQNCRLHNEIFRQLNRALNLLLIHQLFVHLLTRSRPDNLDRNIA